MDKILQALGIDVSNSPYMDNATINQFAVLPYVKIIIYLLLLVIMVILILRVFKIKSVFRGRGLGNELTNVADLKARDKQIIRTNKFMRAITNFVQHTPFRSDSTRREYYQYNINRAGIRLLNGKRELKAEEFNAIVHMGLGILILIGLMVAVVFNIILGIVLIIASIITVSTLPILIIRAIVADKDREIKDNFSDFYLMLHYVLISGSNTPLENIIKSYAKTVSSNEMRRFIDTCVDRIETYGEYNATRIIAQDYKEIAEVRKLMRIIRQLADGGNINQELMGFREELLKDRKNEIEKRMHKLVGRAKASFKLLLIILIQAILSAMAIYLPDLALIKGLFSP